MFSVPSTEIESSKVWVKLNSLKILYRPAAMIYVIPETLLPYTFSRCFYPQGNRAGARLVQSKLKLCVTDIASGQTVV